MADLLHRLRRRLWLLRNPMLRVQMLREHGRCLDCGAQITDNERTYYESNCNRCEAYSPYAQPDPHGDGASEVFMTMLPADKETLNAAYEDAGRGVRGALPAQWPAGLLDRVKAAEQRVQDNRAPRSIPADPHGDVDLVLAEVRYFIEGKWPPFWLKDADGVLVDAPSKPRCPHNGDYCPHTGAAPVAGEAPPSDAAILAIASSVGMQSSTGGDTLVLFARALLAACGPRGVLAPSTEQKGGA